MHSAQSAAQCTAGECGPWRGIPSRSDSGEEKIFSPNWKNILIQYLSFAGHRTLNFATKVWQIIWRSHSISSIFVLSYLQGLRFVFSWSRGLLIYVPLQRKCEICVWNCKIEETEGQLLWFLERMSAHGCCKEKPRDVWCASLLGLLGLLSCNAATWICNSHIFCHGRPSLGCLAGNHKQTLHILHTAPAPQAGKYVDSRYVSR